MELGLGQGDSRNVIIWTSKDLTVNRVYCVRFVGPPTKELGEGENFLYH